MRMLRGILLGITVGLGGGFLLTVMTVPTNRANANQEKEMLRYVSYDEERDEEEFKNDDDEWKKNDCNDDEERKKINENDDEDGEENDANDKTRWKENRSHNKEDDTNGDAKLIIDRDMIRFHIRANSDSLEDMNVKLKVRDEILGYIKDEAGMSFEKRESMEDFLKTHLPDMKNIADEVLKREGFSYQSEVKIADSYFPIRSYETQVVPAGIYSALVINLGEAKGQNWWCALYPDYCMLKETGAVVPKLENEDDSSKDTYKIKFRVREWIVRKN